MVRSGRTQLEALRHLAVVTSPHRAMSSLRASATIMVLRVVLRPSRALANHWTSRLSFWKIRKRQASWISRGGPAVAGAGQSLLAPTLAALVRCTGQPA